MRHFSTIFIFMLVFSLSDKLTGQIGCTYSPTCDATSSVSFASCLSVFNNSRPFAINIGNNAIDVAMGADLRGVAIRFSGSATIMLDGSCLIDECTTFSGTSAGADITVTIDGTPTVFSKNSTPSIIDLNAEMTTGNYTTLQQVIDAALPVNLLSFRGNSSKQGIDLRWETQDETDNDFYTIERSQDGRIFTEVAKVRGKGTTASLSVYEWTDETPLGGTNFYRLSQTDYDGTHAILGVRSIDWEGRRVAVYPNPSVAGRSILLDVPEAKAEQQVQLISIDGRRTFTLQLGGADGRRILLPPGISPGMYVVRLPGLPAVKAAKLLIN